MKTKPVANYCDKCILVYEKARTEFSYKCIYSSLGYSVSLLRAEWLKSLDITIIPHH